MAHENDTRVREEQVRQSHEEFDRVETLVIDDGEKGLVTREVKFSPGTSPLYEMAATRERREREERAWRNLKVAGELIAASAADLLRPSDCDEDSAPADRRAAARPSSPRNSDTK